MIQMTKEKIKQRRSQMLVHSCIYYELNDSIVSDHVWQNWAFELAKLQNESPNDCVMGFFDKEFEGWVGSSGGSHLPLRNSWVLSKARYLLINPFLDRNVL